MKKRLSSLWIVLSILLSLFVLAAPKPWGIAINHATGECGAYWGGDEFTSNSLPEGWTAYYPSSYDETLAASIIEVGSGSCVFRDGEEASCCAELNLIFVDGEIGESKVTSWGLMETFGTLSCLLFYPILLIFISAMIFFRIRKGAFLLSDIQMKGLSIGLTVGFFSSILFFSGSHFSGCGLTYPLSPLLFVLNAPFSLLTPGLLYDDTISSWAIIFLANLILFGALGYALGMIIHKLKK